MRLAVVSRVAVLVASALVLGGCPAKKGSDAAADAGSPTTAGIPAAQAARVVARVGERGITLGEFALALEHLDAFDRLRYQSPERRLELLEEMVKVELLADEAVAKGYDKDPQAVQEIRAVLRDAVLEEAKKGAIAPADVPAAAVRAAFEANRAEYKDPERRRASAIVLRDEATALTTLEAYKKAPTVVTWGDLVRTRSVDAQAKADVPVDLAGDLGFVSPPGDPRGASPRIPEEVRVALFSLAAVGDVSPAPVKVGGKVYLVRLSAKVAASERTFEEAERTLRVKLAQEDRARRERELLDALRKKHPVQIDEAALAAVRIDLAPSDAGRD